MVKEFGHLAANTFRTPSTPTKVQVGGGSITEIYTDQGVMGWGPGVTPAELEIAKSRLLGKDPLDIGLHARVPWSLGGRWTNSIEIALWDLIGKACNQPLAKLWGGGLDKVMLPTARPWASARARMNGVRRLLAKEQWFQG